MKPDTKITQAQIEKWRALAEQSSPAQALLITPSNAVRWTIVDENWGAVAGGPRWEDGAFHVEARRAVLSMAVDLQLLRDYAEYVSECVNLGSHVLRKSDQVMLPMTFDDWLRYREVEQAR